MNTEVYKQNLSTWISDTADFNYFVTYRPKKSKITKYNARKRFIPIMENNDRIETIFYVIESDYSGRCNHAHLLIKGSDLIVQDMATKSIKPTRYNLETNRNVPNEIQYFESIKNKARAIEYVTKHIGKGEMFVRSHDLITKEQVVDERLYNLSTEYDSPIAEMHPNYEYHKKHKHFMTMFSPNKLVKYPYC